MIKDQDFLKAKANHCLDVAKKIGATNASVTIGHSISETVNFRNNNLDESNRSDGLAFTIDTYIGKKKVLNFLIKFIRSKFKYTYRKML
jgi:PmbA protein